MTGSPGTGPRQAELGSSLVEVVVAVIVFMVAILGMVQMSMVTRMQARAAEIATDVWSVSQFQLETLQALDFDSLSSGSDTIRGFPVTWTVSGTDPKTVTVGVTHTSGAGGQAIDSFVTMIADWENE